MGAFGASSHNPVNWVLYRGHYQRAANQYFDPNAFAPPLNAETDLSLAKNIPFSERVRLQFKAEFFNLFNHTNFNTPNTVVLTSATAGPSPTAGQITSTATTSRQIQFGLKLL
ncbi:MAG TPA: hypothetical protein VJN69_07215 [Candidatus Acidoferrales bacterium]|nr:hypothetical protein [Candidatus Acidoferrales bacterium]